MEEFFIVSYNDNLLTYSKTPEQVDPYTGYITAETKLYKDAKKVSIDEISSKLILGQKVSIIAKGEVIEEISIIN